MGDNYVELLDELSDHVVCLPLRDCRDPSLSLRRFFFSLCGLFLSSSFKWRLPSSSHERMVFQNQMDSYWPSKILSSVSDIGCGYVGMRRPGVVAHLSGTF